MPKSTLRAFGAMAENRDESPLAHELPYWDFEDNVMVLADGTLVAGFLLHGLDIETWDAERINQMALETRSLLSALPDGLELTLTLDGEASPRALITAHAELASMGGAADAQIAQHRVESLYRDASSKLITAPRLYLAVYRRHSGPSGKEQLKAFLPFFAPPSAFTRRSREDFAAAARELNQQAAQVVSGLSSCGLAAVPLTAAGQWEVIYRFLNPSRAADGLPPAPTCWHRSQEFLPSELQRLPALSMPSPREQLVFADLVQAYGSFYLDGYHHRIITLKSLPEYTFAGMVSRLANLAFPVTLQLAIKVPEQSKELQTLQARRRMAHSMSATTGGRAADLSSEAKLQSSEELLREIHSTGQKIFYMQLSLLLRSRGLDDLDQITKGSLAKIRELSGAEGIAETVATLKAWKSLLPFGSTGMVRPRRVKTDNLADFLPLYQGFSGREGTKPVCLFKTRGGGLLRYDPFDQALPNYNMLVTGGSGAGKSFTNNQILLQYMSQRPLIYIIDIGGSYRKLAESFGGDYVDIAPAGGATSCTVNPLALPAGERSPSPRKVKFILSLLEIIMADEALGRLPKLERSLLEEAVLGLYERMEASPCLSDLKSALEASEHPSLRGLARMLYPWTGQRPYGQLLDQPGTLELGRDLVVFDLKGLSSYPDLQAAMILVITDFILAKVEAMGPTAGRRKQILMDESWQLLKSPPAAQFMEYCVRTLRKSGAGITFITQGLDEIVQSEIGGAILANTATKLILMQRGDLSGVRKILKLSDHEVDLISSLRQVKGAFSEAFLMIEGDRTVIRVTPTPAEYWLATSDAGDNRLLANWREQHPAATLATAIEALALSHPNGAAKGGAA